MNNSYDKFFEDSAGNKIYLYNKEDSLYTKIIKQDNQVVESLLISEIHPNYVGTMASNDNIMVACNTKNGNITLLSYNNNDWELEDTIQMPLNLEFILLELFYINGSINLLYATKLPIKNYYNVYHLHFTNNTWVKDNIAEIYSDNLGSSYSCIKTIDNLIHFVSIYHDGCNYLIKYNYYNYVKGIWVNKNVTSLNNNNININLLSENNNLHLVCYSNEENVYIYYYFIKNRSNGDDFEFDSLTKLKISNMIHFPLFYISDGRLLMTFISENQHYEYKLNKKTNEWESYLKVPLAQKIKQSNLVVYQSSCLRDKCYCFVDQSYKVVLPVKSTYSNIKDTDDISKIQQEYYIPFLLDQIKELSEEIKVVSIKLNQLNKIQVNQSNAATTGHAVYSNSDQRASYATKNIAQQNVSKTFSNKFIRNQNQNNGFKQKFMDSDSYLQNLDSGFASKIGNTKKNEAIPGNQAKEKKSFKKSFNSLTLHQSMCLKTAESSYGGRVSKDNDNIKILLKDNIVGCDSNIAIPENEKILDSKNYEKSDEEIITSSKDFIPVDTNSQNPNNVINDIDQNNDKILYNIPLSSDENNNNSIDSSSGNSNINSLIKKIGDLFK